MKRTCLILLPLILFLNSCTLPIILAGAAIGLGGSVYYDKRSAQTILEDHNITANVQKNINKDKHLDNHTSVNVNTYDGIVLLTGQAQTPQFRTELEKVTRSVVGVRKIYNEIDIAAPDANLQNANDTWLTTKVKSELLSKQGIKSNELKIVTSNGSVYVMGRVTRSQGDKIANIVRRVSGVNRVIKVFEYSTYS